MPHVFPGAGDAGDGGAAGEPTEELADLLFRVNKRLRQRAHEDLGPLGVTPGQVRALRTLAHAGEPVRMSELADRLGIARRSATSVVDELAGRGLVARHDDPRDRRATTVAVTDDGAALLARLADRRQVALRELTAGIPATDLARLRTTLRRIADARPASE